MKTADFDYQLPAEQIAYYPLEDRSASRLMVLDRKAKTVAHKHFTDLVDYVEAGDLLVFNNSRVIKARLYGNKPSGGKVEILIERVLSPTRALCHVKTSKGLKPGAEVLVTAPADSAFTATLICTGREGALYWLELQTDTGSLWDVMEQCGHIPLPPYIQRADEEMDLERYQTVYAEPEGSVAAPTAGLHFDEALLKALTAKGVQTAFVTLHVGAGTFQPVRVENVLEHTMHSEVIEVPEAVCEQIRQTKADGKRVIAVGTTTVRSLETAARSGDIKPYTGETDIFIYPGFQFKVIDGMVTNFHLPQSTLLMLVSAFADKAFILQAYRIAVQEKYRFFSYGDAMLIL